MALTPQPVDDRAAWNAQLAGFPHPHLLQCWEWGELKAEFGWTAERLVWTEAGKARGASQVLYRTQRIPRLGWGPTLAYCPKGPLLDWTVREARRQVLEGLVDHARRRGAFLLKIDPEVPVSVGPADAAEAEVAPISEGLPGSELAAELAAAGWRRSPGRVQFDNTILVDLTPEEDQILARMKQKTRYNVRLAQRHQVEVRPGTVEDLPLLFRMYAETSARDGFVIRDQAYYRRAWESFIAGEMAQPLVAEVGGEPVAALIVYRFGDTAWYLYGMSRSAHREKMPTYLLQWEAMRWAKAHGCSKYDLVGIPGRPDPQDPLWGLYRFKVGFGGDLLRTVGEWDYPLRPAWYWLYQRLLPRVLAVMRARGRRQTQALLE